MKLTLSDVLRAWARRVAARDDLRTTQPELGELHDLAFKLDAKTASPAPPTPAPPTPELPTSARSSVYFLAKSGGYWFWNCGWRLHGNDKVVLGHQQFQSIPLLGRTERRQSHERVSRPWGDWRGVRAGRTFVHSILGSCEVSRTDGVHAIAKFCDGKVREVHFTNLIERRESAGRSPSPWDVVPKHLRQVLRADLKAANLKLADLTPEAVASWVSDMEARLANLRQS